MPMTKSFRSILLLFFIISMAFYFLMGEKTKYQYPETKKIKVSETIHGIEIIDNYRWLENFKNPQVQAWVTKQNNLTREFLDNLPQRKWAIERFVYFDQFYSILMSEEIKVGERIIRQSREKGKKNWILWTKANEKAPKVELLNMDKYGPHTELWVEHPSPDGNYLPFGINDSGKENNIVRVIDVAAAKILPDTLEGWKHSFVVWLPDSSGFYYSAHPKKGDVPPGEEYSWSSVYFHKIGNSASRDKKIFYHPTDKRPIHFVELSQSKKYLFFYRGYYTSENNEIFFKGVGGGEPLKPLATGFDARYHVLEFEDKFLIQTDWQSPLFRVFITGVNKPERENWKEFIPESTDKLDERRGIGLAAGYIFARYSSNASSKIKIFDKSGRYLRDIPLPYVGWASAGGKWDEPEIKVTFSSYTYPFTQFKYDFKTNKLTFHKKTYPLEVDTSNYITRQVWYRSKDGTKVSMFLLHRKGLKCSGAVPTMIHGYGGFSKSMIPYFKADFIIWLEAGGMVAVPNLRGGGEYGRQWYEAGKLGNKQNTFDDCIAAAEWLMENKYTNPRKLALYGISNGGLLAAAVAVQRPELFKAVWSDVPFTDMIRFHKFGKARVWVNEYGDPGKPGDFKYLLKYSPYHNVKDNTRYPAMLITAGENDIRCHPLHAMKMAARLQAANSGENPIMLEIRKAAGHESDITKKTWSTRKADGWVFMMHHLGMH